MIRRGREDVGFKEEGWGKGVNVRFCGSALSGKGIILRDGREIHRFRSIDGLCQIQVYCFCLFSVES